MKKAILVLTGLLLGLSISWSQSLEKSLLWRISGEGLGDPSYLYGTFHLLCPDDLVFSDETLKAIESSSQVVLELDFDDPGLMLAMQQGMFLPEGKKARDYLSEADYALVSDFFASKLGMPFEPLSGIKPFFLSSMTILYYLDCQPASPEQKLSGLAEEQGKEVLGLETVEEQMAFVDAIPLEDASRILLTGISEVDEEKEMFHDFVRTYLQGDLEGLQQMMDSHFGEEYAEISHALVISRNLDWVPKIQDLVRSGSSFIAVGAGHLPGEEGVIKLLRESGYRVEAVL